MNPLAGALVLAVGMGFGRFSFTGMYPLMVHDGQLTVSGGSLAASANYLGYLIGALILSRVHHRHSTWLCQVAMIGTVWCLVALSLNPSLVPLLTVRLLAGIFSALAMVSASTWLFELVDSHDGAPILYSGVGIGILVSAELIAGSHRAGLSSAAGWDILAAAAALLCAWAWPRVSWETDARIPDQAGFNDPIQRTGQWISSWVMILVYGLAGFGYIVTATYLPLFVKNALCDIDPVQVWAAFGLAAVPSLLPVALAASPSRQPGGADAEPCGTGRRRVAARIKSSGPSLPGERRPRRWHVCRGRNDCHTRGKEDCR
jgi:hypothetical protein